MARTCSVCNADEPVACWECARAVAIGWWQGVVRHEPVNAGVPRCTLCDTGPREMCGRCWVAKTAGMHGERVRSGSYRGLEPFTPTIPPQPTGATAQGTGEA